MTVLVYSVRQVGLRWLVVYTVPGTDRLAVACDCVTAAAAEFEAERLNTGAHAPC